MQRRTAWLLAKAYAELAGVDADTAFRTLIVERASEISKGPGSKNPAESGDK
jgi:hypothetical protein